MKYSFTYYLLFFCLFEDVSASEKALIFFKSDKVIIVDTAKTYEEKKQGLMFREKLDEVSGMILLYKTPKKIDIWMKNTLIDLDIIFIDSEKKILSIKHGYRLSEDLISSQTPVIAVLEIPKNCSKALGLKEKEKINWQLAINNQNYLSDKLDLFNCL